MTSERGKQWAWLGLIGTLLLLILFVNRSFYLQYTPRGRLERQVLMAVSSEETRQVLMRTSQSGCSQVCKHVEAPKIGQNGVDIALYTHYFSDPPVCNGTFVEIGALDGIKNSYSKYFEDSLKWTGLLTEPDPLYFRKLQKNRPKSKTLSVAVCPAGQKSLKLKNKNAKEKQDEKHRNDGALEVECMTLAGLLKQAGITRIDFLSLHVGWTEESILEAMDWSIPIRVLVIEYANDRTKVVPFQRILGEHGYVQPSWDVTRFCTSGKACANSQVWQHKNQAQFKCEL